MQASLPTVSDALISDDGNYRYALTRHLGGTGPLVMFALANPSTADGSEDDATVRKCKGFASRILQARSLVIVNAFAYRATHPQQVIAAHRAGVDVVGPRNEQVIAEWLAADPVVICGWGGCVAKLPAAPVDRLVSQLGRDRPLWCLGTTRSGQPRHPLMLSYQTPLRPWPERASTAPPLRLDAR